MTLSSYPLVRPNAASRADHKALMARCFPRHRTPVPRGTAPTYPLDYAARYGDENEAVPGPEPEPLGLESGFVFGASLTCFPHEPDAVMVS
jgi:hypothetical protein